MRYAQFTHNTWPNSCAVPHMGGRRLLPRPRMDHLSLHSEPANSSARAGRQAVVPIPRAGRAHLWCLSSMHFSGQSLAVNHLTSKCFTNSSVTNGTHIGSHYICDNSCTQTLELGGVKVISSPLVCGTINPVFAANPEYLVRLCTCRQDDWRYHCARPPAGYFHRAWHCLHCHWWQILEPNLSPLHCGALSALLADAV